MLIHKEKQRGCPLFDIYVGMFICIKQRTTSLFLFMNQQLCYSRQNKNFSILVFNLTLKSSCTDRPSLTIGLLHNYCDFFRDFFSLKIGVLVNFFHKNYLLFSVNENAYRKSYPNSPYYALALRVSTECSRVIS